jgi:hypothetical protein
MSLGVYTILYALATLVEPDTFRTGCIDLRAKCPDLSTIRKDLTVAISQTVQHALHYYPCLL